MPAKIIRTYSLETLAPNMPYTLQCGVASGSKLSKTRFSSLFFFWFGLHEFVYPPVLLGVQGIGALSIRRNSDDNMPSTSLDSWTNPVSACELMKTAALTKSQLARSSQEAHEKD